MESGITPSLAEQPSVMAQEAHQSPRWRKAVAVLGVMTATLSGCTVTSPGHTLPAHVRIMEIPPETNTPSTGPTSTPEIPTSVKHPNIVFILTDDLSQNLMPYMPNTNRLIRDQGAQLNVEVEQSLCCTSRSTILTGLYSHNTKVVGNNYPLGGYGAYHKYDEQYALPVWLKKAGYTTSFIGKYLNEYPSPVGQPSAGVNPSFVPPGWDHFFTPVAGHPYGQFNEVFSDDGKVDSKPRHRYENDIFSDRTVKELRNMSKDKPFMLSVDTYSPHAPSAFPARYAGLYPSVQYPRTSAFDEADMSDKPAPLGNAKPLSNELKTKIDSDFRKRVLSVQSVDEMVGKIERTLKARHMLQNTYIFFMSDNGYHMGEHREGIGKYDQYQTTLSVPLYVSGPGIKPGTDYRNVLASNIDIAPTIAAMTGATPLRAVDGVSLLDVLKGGQPDADHRYVLIGRGAMPHYTTGEPGTVEPPDPTAKRDYNLLHDFQGVYDGTYKYVRLSKTGKPLEEFYDERNDPYELNNLLGANDDKFNTLSPDLQQKVVAMRLALQRLLTCAGASCRIAE